MIDFYPVCSIPLEAETRCDIVRRISCSNILRDYNLRSYDNTRSKYESVAVFCHDRVDDAKLVHHCKLRLCFTSRL